MQDTIIEIRKGAVITDHEAGHWMTYQGEPVVVTAQYEFNPDSGSLYHFYLNRQKFTTSPEQVSAVMEVVDDNDAEKLIALHRIDSGRSFAVKGRQAIVQGTLGEMLVRGVEFGQCADGRWMLSLLNDGEQGRINVVMSPADWAAVFGRGADLWLAYLEQNAKPKARHPTLEGLEISKSGIIETSGKFEGEMCYVPYYWDIYLNGFADRDDGDVIGFDVDAEQRALFPELRRKRTVKLRQDDQGFVVEL